MLALRLPSDVEFRLKELSNKTGRSMTWYATRAIVEKIEDLEDVFYAEQVWSEIQAGRMEVHTADDVWGDLE